MLPLAETCCQIYKPQRFYIYKLAGCYMWKLYKHC